MGRWYFTYKLGPERGSLFYNERPEVLGPEEPPPTTVPPQHTTPQTAVQSEPGAPLYNDFKHIQTDICSTISSSVPKLGRPLRSPPSGVGGGSCRFSTRARGVSPRGLDALEWLVGGEVAGEDGDGTHALIPCGVGIGVEVGVWVGVGSGVGVGFRVWVGVHEVSTHLRGFPGRGRCNGAAPSCARSRKAMIDTSENQCVPQRRICAPSP